MGEVRVRPGAERDLDAINELYNHYVVHTPATFDVEPWTTDTRRAWFDAFDGARYQLVVAERDGTVLGYAGSKPFRPRAAYETSVETSVYIAHTATGRGIGTALYTALFAALDGQDVHRAYAGVTMPNDASVALHERFGFVRAAHFSEQGRKDGRYWDVDWFEKPL